MLTGAISFSACGPLSCPYTLERAEKEATVAGIDIYRIVDSKFVDGRIVEQWNHLDWFDLMYQLGSFPTPL
jgi:hypothetical protein